MNSASFPACYIRSVNSPNASIALSLLGALRVR